MARSFEEALAQELGRQEEETLLRGDGGNPPHVTHEDCVWRSEDIGRCTSCSSLKGHRHLKTCAKVASRA